MKPFIQIALATGHVYEVSTDVIADDRAAAVLSESPSKFVSLKDALDDTAKLFADESNIILWARGMNPDNYLHSARLVRFTPPAKDFAGAQWSIHDAPAMSGELDGDQVMDQTVEAVMSTMSASRQFCNISVLNNQQGEPFGAAVLILGDNRAVSAFVTALNFTADQLTGGHIAAGQQAH
jgi:hypothetical protein